MMLKKLNHVGIVVKEFEQAVDRFKALGLRCTEIMEREDIGLRIAFFAIGDVLLELLCFTASGPEESDRGIAVVRAQEGPINHISFEVDNLEEAIRGFEERGAQLVEGFPRPGAHGRVAFFHPETTEGVLIEICQV
jgi:methylmalonyl-CoA epimerase